MKFNKSRLDKIRGIFLRERSEFETVKQVKKR